MAFTTFIPKIEWLKDTVTGDTTISTDTITNVSAADIAKLQVGMFVEGAGIPAETTITAIGATDFTMSNDATASATGVSLSIGFRLEFDYPPKKDPFGDDTRFTGTATVAKSGKIQTITDYIEKTNKVTFSHVSQSIKESFDNFLITHALLGKSFSYFEDKGEPTSELIVEKASRYRSPRFKVITRKGSGKSFLWEFGLEFRRLA